MGRQIKKIGIVLSVLALVFFFLPSNVYAAPSIISAYVCHNLIEEDDFLVLVYYNLSDDPLPEVPADEYYHFRLMDVDGITQIGASAPYPYYSAGYGDGVVAFYFAAEDAPAWEQCYTVRIEGNPEYFETPSVTTYVLTLADYSQLDTREENQTLLGQKVIDIAHDIEVSWSISMVTVTDLGTVLSSTGEAYFRGAVPGIQYMAPSIFSIQTSDPDFSERDWGTDQADTYAGRFDGTWVGEALDNVGSLFNVKWNLVTGIGLLALVIVAMGYSQHKWFTSTPGLVVGVIVFLGGTVMGWVAPAIIAIAVLMFAAYIAYILFFRHG